MGLLKSALGAALLWFMLPAPATAQPSFPERGRAAVVDAANVIPDDVESDLNAQIIAWNRTTGHQFVVATVPNLQGLEIQDYGTRLLRHWRLGRAEANDGAILLLAPNDRQVRIEVGYGLEGALTDARTSVIISETIRPALAGDDVAGALTAGAKRIMQEAAADPAETASLAAMSKAGAPPAVDPPFPWAFFLAVGLILFGIPFLIWRARRPRKMSAEERNRRRYATVPRAEDRAAEELRKWGGRNRGQSQSGGAYSSSGGDALTALQERSYSGSSSYESGSSGWDSSSSSSSSDSGFDSGGGSGGGGGSDSSY